MEWKAAGPVGGSYKEEGDVRRGYDAIFGEWSWVMLAALRYACHCLASLKTLHDAVLFFAT